MATILQYIRDYGAAAAVLFSIITLIILFVVNSKVGRAMRKLVKLKDDTRAEKSEALIEAFALIKRLEIISKEDYKDYAEDMEAIYSKLYMYITDSKIITAYNRIMNTFIMGSVPSTTEFENLIRKELSLPILKNKTKQNYYFLITREEEKEKFRLQKEEEKKMQEQQILQQKEERQKEREQLKELKRLEKEKLEQQKLEEKQRAEIEKQKEEQIKKENPTE